MNALIITQGILYIFLSSTVAQESPHKAFGSKPPIRKPHLNPIPHEGARLHGGQHRANVTNEPNNPTAVGPITTIPHHHKLYFHQKITSRPHKHHGKHGKNGLFRRLRGIYDLLPQTSAYDRGLMGGNGGGNIDQLLQLIQLQNSQQTAPRQLPPLSNSDRLIQLLGQGNQRQDYGGGLGLGGGLGGLGGGQLPGHLTQERQQSNLGDLSALLGRQLQQQQQQQQPTNLQGLLGQGGGANPPGGGANLNALQSLLGQDQGGQLQQPNQQASLLQQLQAQQPAGLMDQGGGSLYGGQGGYGSQQGAQQGGGGGYNNALQGLLAQQGGQQQAGQNPNLQGLLGPRLQNPAPSSGGLDTAALQQLLQGVGGGGGYGQQPAAPPLQQLFSPTHINQLIQQSRVLGTSQQGNDPLTQLLGGRQGFAQALSGPGNAAIPIGQGNTGGYGGGLGSANQQLGGQLGSQLGGQLGGGGAANSVANQLAALRGGGGTQQQQYGGGINPGRSLGLLANLQGLGGVRSFPTRSSSSDELLELLQANQDTSASSNSDVAALLALTGLSKNGVPAAAANSILTGGISTGGLGQHDLGRLGLFDQSSTGLDLRNLYSQLGKRSSQSNRLFYS